MMSPPEDESLPPSLLDLPDDVLRKCLLLLDMDTRLRISEVCKDFYRLSVTEPQGSYLSGAMVHIGFGLLEPGRPDSLQHGYVHCPLNPERPEYVDLVLKGVLGSPRIRAAGSVKISFANQIPSRTRSEPGSVVWLSCQAILDSCLAALSEQKYDSGPVHITVENAPGRAELEECVAILRSHPLPHPARVEIDATKFRAAELEGLASLAQGFVHPPVILMVNLPLVEDDFAPHLLRYPLPIQSVKVGGYSTMVLGHQFGEDMTKTRFRQLAGAANVEGVEYFLPFRGGGEDMDALMSLAENLKTIELQNVFTSGLKALMAALPSLTSLASLSLYINDTKDTVYGTINLPPSLTKLHLDFRFMEDRKTLPLDCFGAAPAGLVELRLAFGGNSFTSSSFESLDNITLGPSFADLTTLKQVIVSGVGGALTFPADLSGLTACTKLAVFNALQCNIHLAELPATWDRLGLQFEAVHSLEEANRVGLQLNWVGYDAELAQKRKELGESVPD